MSSSNSTQTPASSSSTTHDQENSTHPHQEENSTSTDHQESDSPSTNSPPAVQSPALITEEESPRPRPTRRVPNSPNAKSVEVTHLRAGEEFVPGIANQHPPVGSSAGQAFKVGVSEDRNRKCRRTMEDSHSFLYSFGDIEGQGYFAVFDGHAGKHAAEWCGQWFHEYFLQQLIQSSKTTPVPDLLNSTFHIVDTKLSQLAAEDGTHSGCTAVTAFLRLENEEGVSMKAKSREALDGTQRATEERRKALESNPLNEQSLNRRVKRTLYTANVGDARAVLCRGGTAVRLTYDHKGSDQQEAQRIMAAGGFVMNNRVNGVLAVTRSLGDSSMKEFVVGSPYTTETTLGDDDEFLIIACDGLWDVCEDQDAVKDPQEASRVLLDHALSQFSTDNLECLGGCLETDFVL
ncbi:protein phosphatase [Melampsora americana]|nr:protein phosphatase [Melampsora americana]